MCKILFDDIVFSYIYEILNVLISNRSGTHAETSSRVFF